MSNRFLDVLLAALPKQFKLNRGAVASGTVVIDGENVAWAIRSFEESESGYCLRVSKKVTPIKSVAHLKRVCEKYVGESDDGSGASEGGCVVVAAVDGETRLWRLPVKHPAVTLAKRACDTGKERHIHQAVQALTSEENAKYAVEAPFNAIGVELLFLC